MSHHHVKSGTGVWQSEPEILKATGRETHINHHHPVP